jgi:primosomal protein N''
VSDTAKLIRQAHTLEGQEALISALEAAEVENARLRVALEAIERLISAALAGVRSC